MLLVACLWLMMEGSLHAASGRQPTAASLGYNDSFSCPVSCDCEGDWVVCYGDATTTTLDLSNLNLYEVPDFQGVYKSLTALDLSGNSIICLHDGELMRETFPLLESLNVSSNRLKSVESQALQLPTLLQLDLSKNRLTKLTFLASNMDLSLSVAIDVSENALLCGELQENLTPSLCRYRQGQIQGISCTFGRADRLNSTTSLNSTTAIVAATSVKSLSEICNMSIDDHKEKFPLTTLGVTLGGGVALVVIVGAVILIFICVKSGRHRQQRQRQLSVSSSRQTSSNSTPQHRAPPPSVPPAPPPQEVSSTSTSDIYAQVESPLTGSLAQYRESQDYEDGYIFNVESVPGRRLGSINSNGSRKFGLLTTMTSANVQAPPTPPPQASSVSVPSPLPVLSFPPTPPSQPPRPQFPLPPPPSKPPPPCLDPLSHYSIACGGGASGRSNFQLERIPSEPTPYSAIILADSRHFQAEPKVSELPANSKDHVQPGPEKYTTVIVADTNPPLQRKLEMNLAAATADTKPLKARSEEIAAALAKPRPEVSTGALPTSASTITSPAESTKTPAIIETDTKHARASSEKVSMSTKKKPPVKPRRPKSLKSSATTAVNASSGTSLEMMQQSETKSSKTSTSIPSSSGLPRRVELEHRRQTKPYQRRGDGDSGDGHGNSEYMKVVL